MSAAKLIFIFLGLATGHFVYQAFTGKQWIVAVDRSYFQGSAFLTLWVWDRFFWSGK